MFVIKQLANSEAPFVSVFVSKTCETFVAKHIILSSPSEHVMTTAVCFVPTWSVDFSYELICQSTPLK